jgi:hypothetical protein
MPGAALQAVSREKLLERGELEHAFSLDLPTIA